MIFLLLINFVFGGEILPYLRKPIEPTVNNENELSDYVFTFITETDLFAGDQLLIRFPSQYSLKLLAVDTIYQVTFFRWNPDLKLWESITGCSCVYKFSNYLFKITLPDVKAGSYKLSIQNILNPSYGGTGNFVLETRRNDAYQKDINLVDYNYAFGKVGIVKAPTDFSVINIAYLVSEVNKVNQLTISFTTTLLIPKDGKLTLDLSTSTFLILDDQYTVTTNLQGNITRLGLQLRIDGFDNDQSISSYNIIIGGVQNPSYSGVPGQLTIRTWTNNTNTILNQKKSVNFPAISASILTDVQITSHCTLTGGSDVISTSDLTYYQISFSLKNSVDSTGVISINWISAGLTDTCSVISGLYDQSESNQVTCTQSGNFYNIINFKRVQPKTKIVIQFKATNPLASMSNVEVKTYQDQALIQLVDTYSQPIGITLQSYPQFGDFKVDAATLDELRAGATAAWQSWWKDTNLVSAGYKLKLIFSNDFTFTGTTCTAKNDAAVTDTGTCIVSGKTITFTFGGTTFSTTTYNRLYISGINNPAQPGEYPLPVYLLDSSNTVKSRKTIYFNVLPYKLTSITSFRLSQDQATQTLFYFKFPAPDDVPSSQWQSDYNIKTSQIQVEFQTDDTNNPAPANYQFLLDLGTGLSNQASIPCYGYTKLQPLDGNDEIKCNIYVPTASPNPAVIKVHHYRAVLKNNVFELHLPNIQNPRCESYLVTVDDLCRSTASITIKIFYTQNRKSYIMYQNDPTDANLIFAKVLPKIIVKNKYNDNLVGGLPSQPSPKFVPSIINQQSTIQIRYEPGSTKPLKSATDLNQGIIFVFPQLPTTNPQAYIVNKNVKCSLGLLTPLNCYAYKEVGWVVVIPTTLLDVPPSGSIDVTFYLKNFINPFYAADPIGCVQIYTIKDSQQWERAIFQDLPSFGTGSAGSVQIIARRFEANMIDVEYNWLFSLNNDIPADGTISLIYAVNFYDHGGSGHLNYQINQGLEIQSVDPLDPRNTNIYNIRHIKPYKKNTIISIKMTGVKNPPKAGLTNYFGVSSQTSEGFYIDSKTDVTPFTIIQQVAIGEIIFNHFKMYPDNGSPDGSIFPATYEVSFYATRNIPKNGIITITFPSDFTPNSLLDVQTDDSQLRCYVSGSLKSMLNCENKSDAVTLKIQVTLDSELRIEAGMDPLIVRILNIKNFSEDKNSGVVVVQTQYDAVILDDSGTTETNRKATAGLKATFMTNTQYSLSYYPTTEGVQATYELTLKPSLDIKDTATITVEFPVKYPYGLGGNIGCDIPLLSKATNDPIQCVVSAWQVTLSNLKAYAATGDGFVIILNNIRNPNQVIAPQVLTYRQSIRVYIMSNSTHAQEYVENMGSLTFTTPAGILQMQQLYITSTNTRDYADYTLQLLPEIAGTASNIKLGFQSGYSVSQLWSEKKLSLDGTSYDVEPTANNFNFDVAYTLDPTKTFQIIVSQLPNPLDEGICPGYPDVSLYDTTTKQIIMQTYWNLMQPTTPDFKHAGNLIIIDDDDPNHYIEAGTYTNNITLSLYPATEATETMDITPVFDETFATILTITSMTVEAGSKTGYFRIGVDTSISVLRVVIKFTHSITGYIPLRPIYLWIQRYKNISISVTDVQEVPAGGRSEVQTVQMSYGPYKSITFSFYLLNNQPPYSAVYPKTITLSEGQQTGQFWVSCGAETQGAIGQLMTIISGDDKTTFQVDNRVRNFSVVNPDYNMPFIVTKGIVLTTDVAVQVRIVTNEPCTIYFAVTPPFIREVTLEQIKNKTLPYDYFNYPYVFGEYVSDSSTYEYLINVDSLTAATLYQFKAFVQDFSGNLADEPIVLAFNTTGYTDPLVDSLSITATPSITADTNNSLVISGLSGKIHAIAIRYPSYIYVNHFAADSSVIRYRRILEDTTGTSGTDTTSTTSTDTSSTSTDTTSTTTTTTDTTTTTTTDTTTTTTGNNTKSDIDVIQSDPFVPDASDYTCKLISLNYLSQICQPITDRKANFTRIDYYAEQLIINPNGKQISRGENHEGILVQHYATSSGGSVTFKDLVADSDYFIFIAQENNGQYSKTPLMVKGTTRTLFVLYSWMVLVPIMIYMII